MKRHTIKLILWDFNGVAVVGDHKGTSRHFGRKHGTPWKEVYAILYTKYFNKLALNKISDRTAWVRPIQELGWHQDWQQMRKWHLDQQQLRKSVVDYVQSLRRRGYRCVLFTKNYEPWIRYEEKRLHFTRYFDEVLNTQKYNLPKTGRRTMQFVFRRYGVNAREVIYIDDQQQNLVDAQAMGVHTIRYTDFKRVRARITNIVREHP